jgi:predicted RNase H-like HicB family nuclease
LTPSAASADGLVKRAAPGLRGEPRRRESSDDCRTLNRVVELPAVDFVFEPQEQGGYHVYAPELPGLHTQGDSLEEATKNARQALELYVDVDDERLGKR